MRSLARNETATGERGRVGRGGGDGTRRAWLVMSETGCVGVVVGAFLWVVWIGWRALAFCVRARRCWRFGSAMVSCRSRFSRRLFSC